MQRPEWPASVGASGSHGQPQGLGAPPLPIRDDGSGASLASSVAGEPAGGPPVEHGAAGLPHGTGGPQPGRGPGGRGGRGAFNAQGRSGGAGPGRFPGRGRQGGRVPEGGGGRGPLNGPGGPGVFHPRGMPVGPAQGDGMGMMAPMAPMPALGRGKSRGTQNDYSQHFVDTGYRPQNFIRDMDVSERYEEYPKLKELIQRKDKMVADAATPPMYLKVDLKTALLSPDMFGTKFDVILIDPPWEEYVRRAPGVMRDDDWWSAEDIMNLRIEAVADTPCFLFLWVGDAEGLDQGRACLKKWGFRRCEDICWIKTNRKKPDSPWGHTSETLFQHSKEHCLMGIKGTVRRSNDAHIIHANIDTDVMISEQPPFGSTEKPDELYSIIEHFALGRRRLELFGGDNNIRPGWLTLGRDLSSSNFNKEVYSKFFAGPDGKVWQGGPGRLSIPHANAAHLLRTTPEIEALRPRSPPGRQPGVAAPAAGPAGAGPASAGAPGPDSRGPDADASAGYAPTQTGGAPPGTVGTAAVPGALGTAGMPGPAGWSGHGPPQGPAMAAGPGGAGPQLAGGQGGMGLQHPARQGLSGGGLPPRLDMGMQDAGFDGAAQYHPGAGESQATSGSGQQSYDGIGNGIGGAGVAKRGSELPPSIDALHAKRIQLQ